jgi:hypothetical protein
MSEIEIAFKIIDGITALTQAYLDSLRAMAPIKAKVQQARDEGRSLTPDELDELKSHSDALDAQLRAFLGQNG